MQGRRKIGKFLQYHFDEGKTQTAQQCSQTYFDLLTNSNSVTVVCTFHNPVQSILMSLHCEAGIFNCYKWRIPWMVESTLGQVPLCCARTD